MSIPSGDHIPGFEAPLHRALTEPILLGGAPRAIAIVNGTVAAALGLGPIQIRPEHGARIRHIGLGGLGKPTCQDDLRRR